MAACLSNCAKYKLLSTWSSLPTSAKVLSPLNKLQNASFPWKYLPLSQDLFDLERKRSKDPAQMVRGIQRCRLPSVAQSQQVPFSIYIPPPIFCGTVGA